MMKTVSSRSQYLDDQIASIVDSLIFGHLQRKQYSKTLNAFLSESPYLTKDATTVPNAPNQIILNINSSLHDQNLEQIIETFYTNGRFDVSPNLLELGKKLRELTNEFSSELAYGCHSYSNNEQRLYGRKLRARTQQMPTMIVDQRAFDNQSDVNKRAQYNIQQVPQPVNQSAHNCDADLQYSQDMESHASRAFSSRAEDLPSHEIAHHSRRKAAQPLKQSQRVMQYVESQLVKVSNDNLRDKEAGVDNSSFLIDPFLEVDNLNDILKSIDGETLYETLESVEREEAMEADQDSRDSMNQSGGGAALALDIPMHDDHPSTSTVISPIPRHAPPIPSHPHDAFPAPPPPPQPYHVPNAMSRAAPRPLMEQYIQHPLDSAAYNESHAPVMPPPPPPPPVEQPKMAVVEPEKKPSRASDARETSWPKNGSSLAPPKARLPPPPPPPILTPSTSHASGMTPKLSSLGRIPKKGQPTSTPVAHSPSPVASPRPAEVESSKGPEGFRMSRGKIAPLKNGNEGRRDSVDSLDTLRAESVGESDCTMTENEDDLPVRRDSTKSESKSNWDALFEDSPSTVEESAREKERQKEEHENRRRQEMKEAEKRRERERRREKEKKDDDRKDRPKEDRNRQQEKRPVEDRRRDSTSSSTNRDERKRKEQEEQKKIIEAQKRHVENEERARQKKKEEEERRREMREKEEEKRREKEKEMKKIEDDQLKKEREMKAKEERRNELERRRRREAQLKKNNEKLPLLLGDSPLDKIAAVMDGKELKKENVETTTRASSRVMEISSGIERHRPSALVGSIHSSKTGIYLEKAQKLRDTERQPPPEPRRPVRPTRIQMAPMKRPPSVMMEDDESDEEEAESPVYKKNKLEHNKINNILNKVHR